MGTGAQPWHNADWWDMFTPEPGGDRTRYNRAAAALVASADSEPSMAMAKVVRESDPSLEEIAEKVRWWGIVDRIASALKAGAPSIVAYHGTVWNLLTGDWFEMLNPLEVCRALEFSEDMDTARGRCLDAMDFDRGEIEVIFRAKIDLSRAERHGDEIWVLDPTAVSEQQARAIVGDDQWTEWMDSGDLWLHLLSINGLLPTEAIASALASARRMID